MTPERETMIHALWDRYAGGWDLKKSPVLKVPVPRPVPVQMHADYPEMEVLEYRYETGTRDGVPSERVVCEGVTVLERRR